MGMRDFWRDRSRFISSLRYLPWGIEAAERTVARTHQQATASLLSPLLALRLLNKPGFSGYCYTTDML